MKERGLPPCGGGPHFFTRIPMPKNLLTRLKPGASVKVHLFTAALIWSIVGFILIARGYLLVSLAARGWFAIPALGVGTVKSFFLLDRVARKNISRILHFEEGTCIGSVYSWKSWILVLAMIGLGRFLRASVLPGAYVGVLYIAVGWGLFFQAGLCGRHGSYVGVDAGAPTLIHHGLMVVWR